MNRVLTFLVTVIACNIAAAQEAGPANVNEPMRIEPVTIQDSRVKNLVEVADARTNTTIINARLIGPRIAEIVRLGTPIVDEIVDDQDTALLDPGRFTNRQRDATRQYNIPDGARKQGYIQMRIPLQQSPARSATKIARCRGYLWVVYGGEPTPIYVKNPMQYAGRYIEHPKLKELGIRARMLTAVEAPEIEADEKTFALAIETGEDYIRNVTVYDDWLRNTQTLPKPVRKPDDPYTVYSMVAGRFTDDCEIAFFVYDAVERQKVDFEWLDLELP